MSGLYVGAVFKGDAASLVSMSLIFISALLTGLALTTISPALPEPGTLVPITGFANSVVSPALEFKTEGFVLGTAAKCSSSPAL